MDGPVAVGGQWHTEFPCTLDIPQYTLKRGKSIEVVNVLYPPKGPTENLYVKVRFNRGNTGNSYNPLDFSIPLPKLNDPYKANSLMELVFFKKNKLLII